jgi:uncharacterized protein
MKKVLITGGSEGIGLEIAKLLARQGDELTLVARNKEKLGRAIAKLEGKNHSFLTADLSGKEGTLLIVNHLSQNHYDVLINCAGAGMYGRFEELPVDAQRKMMQLNMISLTELAHGYIKNAKKGDSLVNIASTLGVTSFPGLAVYAATKAYVTSFSDSLWWENKSRDVYVLGFCPGATSTSFHETAGEKKDIFPKFVLQQPEQVAKELVNALNQRRKPRAVSGIVNKSMLFFQRFMTRKMAVNMMGSFSPVKK